MPISFATFNLCNYIAPPLACYELDNIYTQAQWQQKQAWLCKYLEATQPDIIGFQEVFSTQALRELMHSLGYPHVVTVDEPELVADYIYQSPVVALASRYPITSFATVPADTELSRAIGLPQFSFSRQPLRATVAIPDFGLCDCYVVHFKSKRPLSLLDSGAGDALSIKVSHPLGLWAASMQRGTEAAMLLQAINNRRQNQRLPVVLMGDFNDTPDSSTLAVLLTEVSARPPQPALPSLHLHDAFALYQQQMPSAQRQDTHYRGVRGSVLDYLLLSDEFDSSQPQSLATVSAYEVYDKHLINPNYAVDHYSSDHAPVKITIMPRR